MLLKMEDGKHFRNGTLVPRSGVRNLRDCLHLNEIYFRRPTIELKHLDWSQPEQEKAFFRSMER